MDNKDNTGITIILLAVICLIAFALILQSSRVQQIPSPSPQPIVQQPLPTQPQQQRPQEHHHQHVCPPPEQHCPPDYLGPARELYRLGYFDASAGRRPNSLYRADPYYMRGYRDGSAYCPPQLKFNIIID